MIGVENMNKQKCKKLTAFMLVLITVLTAVYCYKNRFTKTEEEYTFTHYYYVNDELQVKNTSIMNKYDDALSSAHQTISSYGISHPQTTYYNYKYDKSGNKKLCIGKDRRGDTERKEVFRYDKNGNCIFSKKEDDDGYSICHTDYNENNIKVKEETEIHDLKYDSHNICEYYYDDNDRIIKELNTESDDRFYEYDENGLLKSLKEISMYGWSSEEKYEYDENGLLLRTAHYAPDNTLYFEIKYEYNNESEIISEIKKIYRDSGEIDVYETNYTYAPNGKKASETNIFNDFKTEYITYEYDDDSNLIKQSNYKYYES